MQGRTKLTPCKYVCDFALFGDQSVLFWVEVTLFVLGKIPFKRNMKLLLASKCTLTLKVELNKVFIAQVLKLAIFEKRDKNKK